MKIFKTKMADGAIGPVREQSNVTLQCPKLTKTNYTAWSIMMETVLAAHGLREAIDPVRGGELEGKKKFMAKAMIYQSIPEDVLLQVAKYLEPKDVWEAIRVRYLGADRVQKARLQTLRSELETFQMKETESIDEFAGKLSGMQSKYKSLGSTLEDEVLVRKFLNSMPDKYLPIVASIEQYSDIESMPFEEVVGRLKAYEERVKLRASVEDVRGQLMFTRDDGKNKVDDGGCGNCECCQNRGKNKTGGTNVGREGRNRSSGNQREQGENRGPRRGRDKSRVKCFRCEEFGHFAWECPKEKSKHEEANLTREYDEPTLM